ncbi:MAG: Na+/H+ antiporter NhaC family protein [Bacteroidetes bacterium]|jgi:Na+/H+ antiporter NhaC|nr:Na+/H+ antiporter NhaC family protein [Bacteroidota bacterium]
MMNAKRWMFLLITAGLSILLAGWADLHAFVDLQEEASPFYGTWISLVPPLVAIGLALITREVVLSLFAGIWIGALFIVGFNPLEGTAHSLDVLTGALVNADHIAIIVFSLFLGGMVGVMSRGGGTMGIVDLLGSFATTRKKGQLFSWASALFIFFDDYANTLIRGNALRPMTDRLKISREKLSYIVDSTAAPLAVSAVITTWIGFEITQIQNALTGLAESTENAALATQLQAGADNAFIIFLHSLPYLFYPILALAFVLMTIVMKKEFGPMLEAERRAASGGGVIREGSMPATDTTLDTLQPIEGKPKRWVNAALPVVSVIVVALYGLYSTGSSAMGPGESGLTAIIGNADPFAALLWASFTGCVVAISLVVFQKILTLSQAIESWIGGMQSMLIAVVILILAWGLGGITQEIGTGTYLASMLQDSLPLSLLPGLVFFIAAVTAFSTGTSWGTMAILFPVVVPLSIAMGAGVGFAGGENYGILLGAISSVMAGAVFGDHCSPISDTTVLSSMSSACDLIDHVRTQLPYALVVAFVALAVGELPASFDFIHPVWGLLAGLVILYLILKFYGENPEEFEAESSEKKSAA